MCVFLQVLEDLFRAAAKEIGGSKGDGLSGRVSLDALRLAAERDGAPPAIVQQLLRALEGLAGPEGREKEAAAAAAADGPGVSFEDLQQAFETLPRPRGERVRCNAKH